MNQTAAAAFVLTGTLVATAAQPNPKLADIVRKPIEIRNIEEFPKTADGYATEQEEEPYRGIKVERDIKYGPAQRNLLDVFTTETDSSAQPVLIFVHGGAFAAGDKHSAGSPFYDNVALWAARHGFIGVTMNYRLASQSPWPAGAEDIALAVEWIAGNIGSRGGDGRRIYLLGHSAGATHVASYISHPEFYRVRRRRGQSRYHAFRPLRSHGKRASRSREGLCRRRFSRAMRSAPRLRVWSQPRFR